MDGKLLEPGRFIDLKDGEEIEFGDGKRYTIKYGGEHAPCCFGRGIRTFEVFSETEKIMIKVVRADGGGKSAAAKRWLVDR